MFTMAGSDFQLVLPLSTILKALPNQSTVWPISLSDETELHPALTIRQFPQIRHDVVAHVALLKRVVDAAVPPHARDIVVRHVAVEQEFAGQMLAAAAAAFRSRGRALQTDR